MATVKALTLLTLLALAAGAQDRWQARSMVISQRGIVATSQTLASQAGAQILARGGSAADAAIAANAVLGVVEPMMCGIGGDLFAIYRDARGKLAAINASGPAPAGLSIEYLKQHGAFSMPSTGIHTVSVPGAVDGWFRMHQRFGRLPWRDLFQPAIFYARNGFPVTEIIQEDWEGTRGKLSADGNARRVFLPGGNAPARGQIFRNPELAAAYDAIAAEGPAAYYKGKIAQAILATSRRLGGTLTAADLATFASEWVEPIKIDYRGWTVYQLPPNGQGIGTLTMLNIMEQFPIGEYGHTSVEALHYKIEAQKLAYQDLRRWVGDPRRTKVPVAGLLDKGYAAERAKLVDPTRANCDTSPGLPPSDTVYLSVVDAEGNMASWIQSISDIWGSGVVVDGMGFHLHDRAGGFSFDPEHPNALAPGKRPFHTIIPGFMEKGDEHIGFGIMRGSNQPQAQAQFVSNIVDHRLNIQAALEAPRFTRTMQNGCQVTIESRVPAEVRSELERRGHQLSVTAEYSGLVGGGQAVLHNSRTKVNYGASSPRKDGAAIPEPDSYFGKTVR